MNNPKSNAHVRKTIHLPSDAWTMEHLLGARIPRGGMTSSERPVPRATYRFQLHRAFRFADIVPLAPYLASLGISHAYFSPILTARPGSTHGYDTVDHTRINPELGTIDEFRQMADVLREHGVGIILDIVPNHMGIGGVDNALWLDVLEHGEQSRFASWFDIDWHPAEPSLEGKILVPFLDRSYGAALAAGLIELRRGDDGKFAVWLPGGHKLPLAPETSVNIDANRLAHLNSDEGRTDLDALIARQHWRIAKASVANDEINYRRFFTIADLAGLRIELPEVFEHVHRLVFGLIAEGLVDGLRIDHIDGLWDPKAYCLRLREQSPKPIYIVVEKILGRGEQLVEAWDVEGTTGYDFAALVNPLLVDPRGLEPLSRHYQAFSGVTESPASIEWDAKRGVMEQELAAELEALASRFAAYSRRHRMRGDISRLALKRGLEAFIAAMPIYRTYVDRSGPSTADRAVIATAIAAMRRHNPSIEDDLVALIEQVMLDDGEETVALTMRLQQLTGPVMAKGLEDTALYRFNRLLSLNDVGERPEPFSESTAAFHAKNLERAASFPHTILATSSHDSKRGEDTRARIAALSGHADAWIAATSQWVEMIRHQSAPEIAPDDAYVFFQTLLGAWPGTLEPALADRVVEAMRKSLREARLRSDWANPAEAYEASVERYIRVALADEPSNAFIEAFREFEAVIGRDGAVNGLIELTLKLTVPGVPDTYQGAELWEQSLVDPDNRRPIDFNLRMGLLQSSVAESIGQLAAHWRDGTVKQRLLATLLSLRRERPTLWAEGSYDPISNEGFEDNGVCAFTRRNGDDVLLVAVRLYPGREERRDVSIPYLGFGPNPAWWDVISGQPVQTPAWDPRLPMAVFTNFPLAKAQDVDGFAEVRS
jgi:(1->4)-alpha-D-glucan 1-alpha-D-glucosylmutase